MSPYLTISADAKIYIHQTDRPEDLSLKKQEEK